MDHRIMQIVNDHMTALSAGIRTETADALQRLTVVFHQRLNNMQATILKQLGQGNVNQGLQPQQLNDVNQPLQQQPLQQQPPQQPLPQQPPPQQPPPQQPPQQPQPLLGEPRFDQGFTQQQYNDLIAQNLERPEFLKRFISSIFTKAELMTRPLNEVKIQEIYDIYARLANARTQILRQEIKRTVNNGIQDRIKRTKEWLRTKAAIHGAAVGIENGSAYSLRRVGEDWEPVDLNDQYYVHPLSREITKWPLIRAHPDTQEEYCLYCEKLPHGNKYKYFKIDCGSEEVTGLS